jgi:hypothetical protein
MAELNHANHTGITFTKVGSELRAAVTASGDVTGPGSSASGNLVSFADTTGDVLADSGVSASDFATAAQGLLADSAVQPGDDADTLGSGVATDGMVLTADGSGSAAWESISAAGADAIAAVYVRTDGSDASNGLSLGAPKESIGSAITAASALLTAGADAVKIYVLDGGTYTEDLTLLDGMRLIAPAATIIGNHDISGDCTIDVHTLYAPDGTNTWIVDCTGATSVAHINAKVIDTRGPSGTNTGADGVRSASSGGIVNVTFDQMFVHTNGIGFRDHAVTGFGHIHARGAGIYLSGDNSFAVSVSASGSEILLDVDHILEFGTPTNTTGLNLNHTSATVWFSGNQIVADTAWDVSSGDLFVSCPDIQGTQTGDVANVMLGTADDAADLGSGSATDGYVLTANGSGGSAWELAADKLSETIAGGSGFTNQSGAVALDLSAARHFHHTMTGNITGLSFSNVPTDTAFSAFWTWVLKIDGTGGYSLSGTPTVTWVNGVSFSDLDLTANAVNIVNFWRVGSTTYAFLVSNGSVALPSHAVSFPDDGTVLIASDRDETIDLANAIHKEIDGTAGTGTLTYKKNNGSDISVSTDFDAGDVLAITLSGGTAASTVTIPRYAR